MVDVWTPATTLPTVEHDRIDWSPPDPSIPFTLELAQLFKPI